MALCDQNYPMREWEKSELLEYILPDAGILKKHPVGLSYQAQMNSWDMRNILVYGKQRSAKTEWLRLTAQYGVERYTEAMFDAWDMGSTLARWLDAPTFSHKPIQMHTFDDSNQVKLRAAAAQNWDSLRHMAKAQSHLDEGMLITFIGTHEIFGLPKVIRESIDVFIARSVPTTLSFYDHNFLKRLLGVNGYAMLENVSKQRLLYRDHEELIVFRIGDEVGYMNTPLATNNYLRPYDWNQPSFRPNQRNVRRL